MTFFNPEEVEIVRAHRRDTVGYILADTKECLGIQAEEVRRVRGRALSPITSASLPSRPLPKSWILAVVLCPGDTTRRLSQWARRLSTTEHGRVRFYEHGGVHPQLAYADWVAGGLPSTVLRFPVRDFKEFIVLFGQHLNQQILKDHRS